MLRSSGLLSVADNTQVTAGADSTAFLEGAGITNNGTVSGPSGVTLDAGTGTLINTERSPTQWGAAGP